MTSATVSRPPGRPPPPGPPIEEHLYGTAGAAQSILLRYLVLLDIDYRRLRSEEPTEAEYEGRFPRLVGQFLAEALAAPPGEARVSSARPAGRPGSPAEEAAEPDRLVEVETMVRTPASPPHLRSQRYVVGKFHARGGIGEVWLAQDSEIGRPVALKRLRKKREDQKDRFLIEAQVTGQLEHPGIVPVYDVGVDEDGHAFYVMSFIRGRPLREAIEVFHADASMPAEARDMERARLLGVLVKVCQAVAYAHHRGVIHRDLKPDNVMLGPFGETLVLDWGMAKVRNQPDRPPRVEPVQPTYSSGSGDTRAGSVMGSPGYMAPEMAEGLASEADERTDVYLLGATLYHVLTGRVPREGTNYSEVTELARTTRPPPPRQVKADVPRALEAVCQKAMAHRAQDRYASALDLAAELERYLAGTPVSAYREPLAARAWRWCKRHRQVLTRAAAAVIMLVLIVGGAGFVWTWKLEADERVQLAEMRKRVAEAEATQAKAETKKREREDKARRDLGELHRLAEVRYFHAPNTTPAGEAVQTSDARRPQNFDSVRGEKAERGVIELADRLGKELADLKMAAEQAALKTELHDFLLVTAQARTHQAPDRKAAAEILESLKKAENQKGPSRSSHRLRASCYRVLGEKARADEEEGRAKAAAPTPLDHFLQAEEYRAGATEPTETSADALAWRPSRALLEKAIAEYQLAIRGDPKNFWYHLQMGRCYLGMGRGNEAREALGTCIALRPEAPWGYSARGLTLALDKEGKHYAEAKADLEKALQLDEHFRPARLHRGVLAWIQRNNKQEDFDKQALEDFAAALKPPEEQRLIEAAYYRGQLHIQRKDYKEALKDFDAVVKEVPRFRPVYLSRAQAQFLRDATPQGLSDLTEFLDLGRATPFDPKDPALRAARGRLLLQLIPKWGLSAKLPLAQEELEAARKQGHRTAELFDDLGSVADRLGQYDRALEAYRESLKRKGSAALEARVYTKCGWLYAQYLSPLNYHRARDEFAEAIRRDPTHADAHAGLGYVHAIQKASAEAQREVMLALNREGDNYVILHNLACVYAVLSEADKDQKKQDQAAAIDLLQRAVKVCRDGGDGDIEVKNIVGDTALEKLRDVPDFWERIGVKRPK